MDGLTVGEWMFFDIDERGNLTPSERRGIDLDGDLGFLRVREVSENSITFDRVECNE